MGNLCEKFLEVVRHRHEANSITMIIAHRFYTGRFGYKLCLSLYLDGDGLGKNSHISFFLTIL